MFALVEACDFESTPPGGQLSFCKQLIEVYGNDIYLVGVAKEGEPVGVWFAKNISGVEYNCFNIYRSSKKKKPLVPLRLKTLFALIWNKKKILGGLQGRPIFFQAPESLIAFHFFGGVANRYYYIFHGVENPLSNPRYKWGLVFAGVFDFALRESLKKATVILACCDHYSIKGLVSRLRLDNGFSKVIKFPTRYDDRLFFPMPSCSVDTNPVNNFVVVGRLNKVKGWDFILSALCEYKKLTDKNFIVEFVGDGEDRSRLEEMAAAMGISESVRVTGFLPPDEIRQRVLNSDLMLVGSLKEGWSIAMLETLACGRPIVTTNVSGAKDLVENGLNGFVAEDRDPKKFAELILRSLKYVPKFNSVSISIADKYKISGLKYDLDLIIGRFNDV